MVDLAESGGELTETYVCTGTGAVWLSVPVVLRGEWKVLTCIRGWLEC